MDDIDVMARFANKYMEQTDGAHDISYWRDLAEGAREESELCSEVAERTFTTAKLTAMMESLRTARQSNVAAPDFAVEYHLRYLLAAAGEWIAGGEAFDAAENKMKMLRGELSLPKGTDISDMAKALGAHLNELIDAAPENWRTLFKMLKS